jgi:arylsulfatase A-like enzyme
MSDRTRRRLLGAGLLAAAMSLAGCSKCSPKATNEDAGHADAAAMSADAGDTGRVEVPADRAERPVFRLGPSVLLAHVQRGDGLWLDAGSAGFVKYLRLGLPELRWALREEREGVRVAVPERVASIEVPLTATQAAAGVVYLGVHAPAKARLSLKIDGRKAGDAELAPGWQVARVEVPEKRLREGENFIALEVTGRQRPALAWIQVGGVMPAGALAAGAVPGLVGELAGPSAPVRYQPDDPDGPDDDVLVLARDAGLVYHLYVPESARLVTAVQGADCRVSVRARAGIGSVEEVLSGAGGRAVVDLSLLAGRVARIELAASGCAEARLVQPRLTVAGSAQVAPSGPRPRYVVLWLMSGLRADRVRPFAQWARPEAPGFERLAQTGTAFSPAWTQATSSRAARAALWTGRYPIRLDPGAGKETGRATGNRERARGVGPAAGRRARAPSLGVELREAGFHTMAVTAAMERTPGFADGFESWERVESAGDAQAPAAGAEVLAQALERLDEHHQKGPVFLFVETADSRLPWTGHAPWIDRYDPGAYEGPFAAAASLPGVGASPIGGGGGLLHDRVQCEGVPADRDLNRLRAIYDTTVSYQDALLVQLVDRLAQLGILDQTLLVVTSDHGQEIWEDGRCGHGTSFRESLLGVPLLLHYPPLVPGGQMMSRGAEAVDVLPTLLRVLGLEMPEPVQGQSLLELAGGPGYPQPMFAAFEDAAHAVRLGGWKLLAGRAGVAAVYDVGADPNEARNLAATHATERRFLTDILSLHVFHRALWNQRVWGSAANLTVAGWHALEDRAP